MKKIGNYLLLSLIVVAIFSIQFFAFSDQLSSLLSNLLMTLGLVIVTLTNFNDIKNKFGHRGIPVLFLFLILTAICFVLEYYFGPIWNFIGIGICILFIIISLIQKRLHNRW
jgi:hypothetical protein